MTLKLGIIGFSDGNGHPYSWSAIFNGYEPKAMQNSGFPVISKYLAQQTWPKSKIKGAKVVSVWTQDKALSKSIASASKIETIVSQPEDMIGNVDAILLARDDAENHLKFATPFLKKGIPIYIDKPIALTLTDLKNLYSQEQYQGQIFSCSALRYSNELIMSAKDRKEIGEVRQIVAFTPKSWKKYAVHIIEPVLSMLSSCDQPLEVIKHNHIRSLDDSSRSLVVSWSSGIQTAFFATGEGVSSISIRVVGTKGYKDFVFTDSFSAFKTALEIFVNGVKNNTMKSDQSFHELVVRILEKGL